MNHSRSLLLKRILDIFVDFHESSLIVLNLAMFPDLHLDVQLALGNLLDRLFEKAEGLCPDVVLFLPDQVSKRRKSVLGVVLAENLRKSHDRSSQEQLFHPEDGCVFFDFFRVELVD
jgi:hypothetical protein